MSEFDRWGDSMRDRAEYDRWATRSREEAWGLDDADLVSVYTRQDAIADGVLVDATPEARAMGIALPAALTATAWAALGCDDTEALRLVLRAVTFGFVVEGRIARDVPRLDLVLRGPEGWVACWATVDADGDGLTVMLEGED
jgi:hypothetical protein